MMKIKEISVLLAVCAALCSCSALGKYKHETGVPQNLYGDVELSDTSASLASFRWQEIFSDPILRDYIDTAIANNYDYRAALERINQARAQLLGAKLAYIPSIALTPSFAANFSGTDGFGNRSYDYNVNASASWQLDVFSKTNNLRMAKATVEQMEDYRQAVLSSLIASVANNYYTLLMLDAQYDAARAMLRNWEESVETIKVLKACGEADQVAVSQYEANHDDIYIKLQALEQQITVTENAMGILLGKGIKRAIRRNTLDDQHFEPADISVGIPVQMLALRPDVKAAERNMELAFYSTKGALLNFFPKLSLTGAIGMVNPVTGALSPITLLGSVGAGLVAPILTSGSNTAAYRAAKSRQAEARLDFDRTLLNAGREVNDALSDLNTRIEMARSYRTRVLSLQKAYEDTEYLMRNSFDKTYLDVLYANTNYFTAKLSAIENESRILQARVNLYTALGGGTIE